jgi:hypothetical protein
VHHTVSFESYGFMDDQREDLGEILIPGLVDVASMVHNMAADAEWVADEAKQLLLPSE